MSSDIAISVKGISKAYTISHGALKRPTFRDVVMERMRHPFRRPRQETFWALNDVSFDVKQGEVVGIIGRNGAGKSTLLKILSRITEPTTGRIELYGRVGSLLEVGTGFHPELTGRENVFLNGAILGMSRAEIRKQFDAIVDFAEVEKFIDTPVKRYSSGMYVRLAFAVAAHLNPEILIVDEVLAVGDAEFQKKCLGKMGDVAKGGRTVLFVSHNMAAVQHLCGRAAVLVSGNLGYQGPAREAVAWYEQCGAGPDLQDQAGHIVFQAGPPDPNDGDFRIERIEMIDGEGNFKSSVATFDQVGFRIWYSAKRLVRTGSVLLMISTRHGVQVFLSSAEVDSGMLVTLEPGTHAVECHLQTLPLAAGDYVVGIGLTIPRKEFLFENWDMGIITVDQKDVYKSGRPPILSRCIVATPHIWKVS